MDGRRPAQAGAQNPAYRPAHPPPIAPTWGLALLAPPDDLGRTLLAHLSQWSAFDAVLTSPPWPLAWPLTAAAAWVRRQWDGRQSDRHERRRRNWHGYIDVGGINTTPVRLAEPPKTSGAVVPLEVLREPGGKPDEQLAAGLRNPRQSARRP